MHTPFTQWMNFLHAQMTCTTDLYDCVNTYNILHCNISYMSVCLWHVPHPTVLWQSQSSMECIHVCMYVLRQQSGLISKDKNVHTNVKTWKLTKHHDVTCLCYLWSKSAPMVGDKKPDEVIHECKYKCLYQRHYMVLCSYSAQIPVLIITSKQSFFEFLDPKDEGSKLLQNVSKASHLKDLNLYQHYHQNPKFHNAMCCFTYHTLIWIKVFMLWLPLYTIWEYRTKPDVKIVCELHQWVSIPGRSKGCYLCSHIQPTYWNHPVATSSSHALTAYADNSSPSTAKSIKHKIFNYIPHIYAYRAWRFDTGTILPIPCKFWGL
jgi:hypothetical protein